MTHPVPRLLFALITTISPNINTCEHQIINIPNQDWTTILLDKMTTLRNPPERHINIVHPYIKFVNNHKKLINPPTTIHNEIFDFIRQETTPPTIHTLTEKFPFLPNSLLNETLRIYEPLNEYHHPPPIPQIPPPSIPNEIQNINNNTQIISQNASSLNTALPNLQDIIQHTNIAIIVIQETKLTATKSTKYIQNLFPHYKLIFNNTHALTRCIQQRIPYTPARGGLLTLINKKYAFPGNITKIPTPANISPYLQIIHIKNHPMQSWLIIHLYMPSHTEDLRLIPIIQQTIRIQINPNHTYILCGDFNRDIALIGRQNEQRLTLPQEKDILWNTYTESLFLTYIPTNTNYSRQGGNNYTHTSLIDGFYTNAQNHNIYISTTFLESNLNSDHLPIILHIPPNKPLARQPPPPITPTPKIMNPIPQEKLDRFKTIFFEENAIQLNNINNLLSMDQLNENQWQSTCSQLDHIIQKISETITNTCSTTPIPTLTNRTSQQGGFLPRELQKQWKKHIKTYHLIRKAIYITNNTINWHNHPIMYELNSHTHINIPPPPNDNLLKNDWIKELATLAKTANTQARKITTKYTKECIKKAISKYRQLYETSPKK